MSTTCACSTANALKVLASDGEILATVKSDRAVRKDSNKAYLEIVVDEATKIIANLQNVDEEKAKNLLYNSGYTVYTAMDKIVSNALAEVCAQKETDFEIAAAITNLNADLVAVYSTDAGKKSENLATKLNPPCSSLKPLSVYAPALDNGTINWASRYEDSAYKYIKNLEGVMSPWPNNATGVYSGRYAYIHQAIAESLNTVAVKCLADYGINNSIKFLEDNFGIALLPEKTSAAANGQEEIMGNIALGYLTNGVSVVDMAGYYQIFANGGKYETPKTVLKICDSEGNEIYSREYSSKQVIKQTTAEIMNYMLKDVVAPGGTGEKAKCEKVEAAGKTGTDDSGGNNWFVGVTPEYSWAFWHGYNTKNNAAEVFSSAVNGIYNEKTEFVKNFTYSSDITQVAYCTESGKQFKSGCSLIRMGYFVQDNVPSLCDRH